MTQIAEPKLLGVVETLRGNAVTGWTVSSDHGVVVVVKRGAEVIGKGGASIPRPDLSASMPACRGYHISLSDDVSPAELVDGSVVVSVQREDDELPLPLWKPLRTAGIFTSIDFDQLRSGWLSVPNKQRLSALLNLSQAAGGLGFGRLSIDSAVQIGRNGFLFLAGGSNHLSSLYAGRLNIDIGAWVDCFSRRKAFLAERGVDYVQIAIPEKTSVLHEFSPYTASCGSAAYLAVINEAKAAGIPIFDGLSVLSQGRKTSYFPLGDSHLSTEGAELLVRSILSMMRQTADYRATPMQSTLHLGDLMARFESDGDMREVIFRYAELFNEGQKLAPKLLSSHTPPTGHLGTRRVWRCEGAPIPLRVVCFGNSFFERGGASSTLSWWFARLFREFHFVWSPVMIRDYIDEVVPDVVVCQTIERFLTRLPSH